MNTGAPEVTSPDRRRALTSACCSFQYNSVISGSGQLQRAFHALLFARRRSDYREWCETPIPQFSNISGSLTVCPNPIIPITPPFGAA